MFSYNCYFSNVLHLVLDLAYVLLKDCIYASVIDYTLPLMVISINFDQHFPSVAVTLNNKKRDAVVWSKLIGFNLLTPIIKIQTKTITIKSA